MTSLTTAGAQPAPKPKLLDRLRDAIRVRHYSIRTDKNPIGYEFRASGPYS